jgi:short-subunit dehydrogenase/acyl dehydratase/acyl carrier protein
VQQSSMKGGKEVMRNSDRRYEDVGVGDYVVLRRIFSKEDFWKFSDICGDSSPIHHDEEYAKAAGMKSCLVPQFLYASVVSAVAGMFLPGHRSLILKTTVSGIQPVYYEEEVTYSSVVVAKTDQGKVLNLQIIGFIGSTILFSIKILVKVRDFQGQLKKSWVVAKPLQKKSEADVTLITGATSQIGEALADQLASRGQNLVIGYHSNSEKAEQIAKRLRESGIEVWTLSVDSILKDRAKKIQRTAWFPRIGHVVHLASAPISSSWSELMESNYVCIRCIVETFLPKFLGQQYARIINVGTALAFRPALDLAPDYVASKVASMNYINSIKSTFSPYGIEACTIAPDAVLTEFSSELPIDNSEKMLPEYVAEEIVGVLLQEKPFGGDCLWLSRAKKAVGLWGVNGFSGADQQEQLSPSTLEDPIATSRSKKSEAKYDVVGPREDLASEVLNVASRVLGIPVTSLSRESGLTRTPGWGSLKHIEILNEVEKDVGARFRTSQLTMIETIGDILRAIESTS